MNTKMKGLLKGLRYISQIFEENKEPEMQIGFPTDVKHVAHIGCDGPSVDSPSWMNKFDKPDALKSAPLNPTGDPKENPEIKWVSEDSSRRGSRTVPNSPPRDVPTLPKSSNSRRKSLTDAPGCPPSRESSTKSSSSRRKSLTDSSYESTSKESSTRSRQSRRSQSKDSADGSVRGSCGRYEAGGSEVVSDPRNLPDIPKKTGRKKSKDGEGSTRLSRSSKANPNTGSSTYNSDSGLNDLSSSSSLKTHVEEQEKESIEVLENSR